ncbi:hypothetical protein ABT297_09755 [Dactylosporangium sp. NPDC000555]|uniref:hypothetical protein n=1 Tax=Dactylosporangium sp. NPDC000555 TaxID=3154260 RepID=UPI0033330F3A
MSTVNAPRPSDWHSWRVTTLGLPFDTPPRYAPVDEGHFPYPTTTYALSKVVGETLARRSPAGAASPSRACACPMCTPSTGRAPGDYAAVPGHWADMHARK